MPAAGTASHGCAALLLSCSYCQLTCCRAARMCWKPRGVPGSMSTSTSLVISAGGILEEAGSLGNQTLEYGGVKRRTGQAGSHKWQAGDAMPLQP